MGGLNAPPVAADVVMARAYLSRVAEPASIPVWACVRREGPVEAAALIRAGRVPADVLAATEGRRTSADPEADLDAAQRHGIQLVTPEDDAWPHFALSALEAAGRRRLAGYLAGDHRHRDGGEPIPPLALWVRGAADLATAAVRSVAIVGARAASAYGEHVATELGHDLGRAGVSVLSGGAYGIDAAAHRGALVAGTSTWLVSAGGLDRPYPIAHAALYEQVAGSGLLISERPPGSAPHRGRFLTRNRLIASLTSGTVVVEAARRSGALNTARHAVTLGRPLMVVPGPVTSAMSAGCHELLREPAHQAVLVTSAEEVRQLVGPSGVGLTTNSDGCASVGGANHELRDRLDALDATARQVFEGLSPRHWVREDELAARSGVGVVEVLRALPPLQLAELIETSPDGYRIASAVRRMAGSR